MGLTNLEFYQPNGILNAINQRTGSMWIIYLNFGKLVDGGHEGLQEPRPFILYRCVVIFEHVIFCEQYTLCVEVNINHNYNICSQS